VDYRPDGGAAYLRSLDLDPDLGEQLMDAWRVVADRSGRLFWARQRDFVSEDASPARDSRALESPKP
jgi:hypothetical protein